MFAARLYWYCVVPPIFVDIAGVLSQNWRDLDWCWCLGATYQTLPTYLGTVPT